VSVCGGGGSGAIPQEVGGRIGKVHQDLSSWFVSVREFKAENVDWGYYVGGGGLCCHPTPKCKTMLGVHQNLYPGLTNPTNIKMKRCPLLVCLVGAK